MKKLIVPILFLMILATSGCIIDPFYDGYGHGYYGHHDRGYHGHHGDDD